MKEILKTLSETITAHQSQETNGILFENPVISKHIPLTKDNFHHLEKRTHAGEIYFIDGGSSEIIATHAFSLLFIRTAYVAYQNFTKTKTEKREYFVLSKIKQGHIEISVHPMKGNGDLKNDFSFALQDTTLTNGTQNVTVSVAAHTIRRFFELQLGEELAKKANKGDLIVLDGSLHSTVTHEKQYMDLFLDACKKNEVLACALSKTTKLMTDNGVSLPLALRRLANGLEITEKRWFYHPFVTLRDDDYPAELFMSKLHPQAKYTFLFELFKEQKFVSVEKVLGSLALTSQDPVFLGYPYGLVKVDELARVSNEEINYQRMRLSEHLNIEELEQNMSAHKILDSIKF